MTTTGTLSAEARRCCNDCGRNVQRNHQVYVQGGVRRCCRCHSALMAKWKASYRTGRQRLRDALQKWWEQVTQERAAS